MCLRDIKAIKIEIEWIASVRGAIGCLDTVVEGNAVFRTSEEEARRPLKKPAPRGARGVKDRGVTEIAFRELAQYEPLFKYNCWFWGTVLGPQ